MSKIGSKIKELRDAKGWSQKELAEKAGLPLITVASWEQGVREPKATLLFRIARVLGASCEAFDLGAEEDESEPPPTPRGRPKKPTGESEDTGEPEVKRPRGRPKKE